MTKPGSHSPPKPSGWLTTSYSTGGALKVAYNLYEGSDPNMHVMLVHGFGEHRGCYAHVIEWLHARGASVYMLDLPHHGQSAGQPAMVKDYGVLSQSVADLVNSVISPRLTKDSNLVVIGHSNGGLVTLDWLRRYTTHKQLKAVVLCNPFLGLSWALEHPIYWLSCIVGWVLPKASAPLRMSVKDLSDDASIYATYRQDKLRFRRIGFKFFSELIKTARHIRQSFVPKLPVLLLLTQPDHIVNDEHTSAWYNELNKSLGDKIIFPQAAHELFQSKNWEAILEQSYAWLVERSRA